MKDKILAILEKHSTPFLEGKSVHWSKWEELVNEILWLKLEPKLVGMSESDNRKCLDDAIALGMCAIEVKYADPLSIPERINEITYNYKQWGDDIKFKRKKLEQEYLEMFNRIKKSFCEKRNMKFTPTRVVSKPSQLHARLKDYTMDELGKVIYNAFNDQYHIETKWKHLSTEFLTRADKVEKYFV